LAARLRFMARNVLDLRSNNWVPRREEVNVLQLSSSILKYSSIIVLNVSLTHHLQAVDLEVD
jgi:hypothetical protein